MTAAAASRPSRNPFAGVDRNRRDMIIVAALLVLVVVYPLLFRFLQANLGFEFAGRRLHSAQDLDGSVGQHLPFGSQADPTTDALHELGVDGRFQAREVVAHRRLGVMQLLRRFGHRPASRHGGQDLEMHQVQH